MLAISDHEISVSRAVLKSVNAFNHNERFMLTVCGLASDETSDPKISERVMGT